MFQPTPTPAAGRRSRLQRQAPLPRRTLILVSSVFTALTVLFLVGRALFTGPPVPPQTDGAPVFMTVASVPKHVPITPAHVTVVRIPATEVPANAITDPADLAGMVAKEVIPARVVLTTRHVVRAIDVQGIAVRLPDGYHAVTIIVPEIEAVGGAVVPGNRINVLATFAQPTPVTVWAAKDAEVLQAARIALPAATDPRAGGVPVRQAASADDPTVPRALALTLKVSPDQVPTLLLGLHVGKLAIVVLPQGAMLSTVEGGVSLAALVKKIAPDFQQGARDAPVTEYRAPARQAQETRIPVLPAIPAALPPTAQRPASSPTPTPPPAAGTEPVEQIRLTRVEVIRGADVRVELVPPAGRSPHEISAYTRGNRQQRPAPVPSPTPVPPPPAGGSR